MSDDIRASDVLRKAAELMTPESYLSGEWALWSFDTPEEASEFQDELRAATGEHGRLLLHGDRPQVQLGHAGAFRAAQSGIRHPDRHCALGAIEVAAGELDPDATSMIFSEPYKDAVREVAKAVTSENPLHEGVHVTIETTPDYGFGEVEKHVHVYNDGRLNAHGGEEMSTLFRETADRLDGLIE